MNEQEYDSEKILQELLQKYHNLLAGDQIDEVSPRRWILIAREFQIPDEKYSGGRWAVDHLFLDQDGIPTLVEVKRSSDSRIRREVIGQMMEYAANAVVYWTVEQIQSIFEAKCESESLTPEIELKQRLQLEIDYDVYWQKVKSNFQIGKISIYPADMVLKEQ